MNIATSELEHLREEVFTNKQLSGLHTCIREIPYINHDNV